MLFMSTRTVQTACARFVNGEHLVQDKRVDLRRKLNQGDLEALWNLVYNDPTQYLDELRDRLRVVRNKTVSLSTVCRALKHLKLRRKQARAARVRERECVCVRRAARVRRRGVRGRAHSRAPASRFRLAAAAPPRDGAQRGAARQVCAPLRPGVPLVPLPVDGRERRGAAHARGQAASKKRRVRGFAVLTTASPGAQDARSSQRMFGRAYRGERTSGRLIYVRGKRYSVTPVMSARGLLAWYVVEGSMNQDRFNDFVHRSLVRCRTPGRRHACMARPHFACAHTGAYDVVQLPVMRPHPGDHSVIVLDNFVTHHNQDFVTAVEDKGGHVLHLPPYLPDFNPIELVFAQIKAWLRRNRSWVATVRVMRVCATPSRPLTPFPDAQVDQVTAIDAACASVTAADCRAYIERACAARGDFYLHG
jgi:hypothetical protein